MAVVLVEQVFCGIHRLRKQEASGFVKLQLEGKNLNIPSTTRQNLVITITSKLQAF